MASNVSWDQISQTLAVVTVLGFAACVLAGPFYGPMPLLIACGSFIVLVVVARLLSGG